MKRTNLLAVAAALLAGQVAASAAPDQTIRTATEQVQSVIKERRDEFRANPTKFYHAIDELLTPYFDLPYVSQLVLGRHWRPATADQRVRFQHAFKQMLIRSYADAMIEHGDSVRTEWQPLRLAPDATDVMVHSRVVSSSGRTLPMGFALRLTGDGWKAYDIVVENLSLITSFRGQISSEIRKGGVDAVIQRLEAGYAPPAPHAERS